MLTGSDGCVVAKCWANGEKLSDQMADTAHTQNSLKEPFWWREAAPSYSGVLKFGALHEYALLEYVQEQLW